MYLRKYKKIFLIITFFSFILNYEIKPAYSEKINNLSIEYLEKEPEDEYILGEGDTINVVVKKSVPSLNGFHTIDANGYVYLAKLKRVYIAGLTITELSNLLQQKYSEIINFPEIDLKIIGYRPIKVYVDGEVSDPGKYTLITKQDFNENEYSAIKQTDDYFSYSRDEEFAGLNASSNFENRMEPSAEPGQERFRKTILFPTLFDAIQTAGGITRNSDLTNVEIIRKNSISKGGGKKKASINFLNYLKNGDTTFNIKILDGDLIKVNRSEATSLLQLTKAVKSNLNAKLIRVFVRGRVNEPGLITVNKSSTLSDAIESAGGTKFIKGKVRFIRFNSDGSIEKRHFAYRGGKKEGSYRNPYLENGDVIIVGRSAINVANEIITDITTPFIGIYSTYKIFD